MRDAIEVTTTAIGTSSTRRISSATGIPQSSVNRVLKRQLQFYPYRLHRSHALQVNDSAARLQLGLGSNSKMTTS